jgi:hypothetical protein
MSIDTIRTRLHDLQLLIPVTAPVVITAYDQLPRSMVPTANMPAFLNFVRDADYDDEILGEDVVQVTRKFLMWLLVKPAAEGEEGEGEALVEPWIDVVVKYFYARPSLGNLTGILYSHITKDSGPKRMVWPGTPTNPIGVYWGAEFQISVVELFNRVYASNE